MITCKYENGLYHLQETVSRGEENVIEATHNKTKVWHSRLSHMSSKNMKLLLKKVSYHRLKWEN